MVYRFGTSLYYANAPKLLDRHRRPGRSGRPAALDGFDCAAIGGIDYTASAALIESLNTGTGGTSTWSSAPSSARCAGNPTGTGISATLSPGAYYDTPGEALEAYDATKVIGDGGRPSADDN